MAASGGSPRREGAGSPQGAAEAEVEEVKEGDATAAAAAAAAAADDDVGAVLNVEASNAREVEAVPGTAEAAGEAAEALPATGAAQQVEDDTEQVGQAPAEPAETAETAEPAEPAATAETAETGKPSCSAPAEQEELTVAVAEQVEDKGSEESPQQQQQEESKRVEAPEPAQAAAAGVRKTKKKKGRKGPKCSKKSQAAVSLAGSAYAAHPVGVKGRLAKRSRAEHSFGLYGNAALIRPVRESLRLAGEFGCERPVLSPRLAHSDALASTSGNQKSKARTKELRKELAKAHRASRNESDKMDDAYAWEKDATSELLLSEEGARTMAIPDEIDESAEGTSSAAADCELSKAEREELVALTKKIEAYQRDLVRVKELSSILQPRGTGRSPKSPTRTKSDKNSNSPSGAVSQKGLVEKYGQLDSILSQLKVAKQQLRRARAKSAKRLNQGHRALSEAGSPPGQGGDGLDTCPPGLGSPGAGAFGRRNLGLSDDDEPELSWSEVQKMVEGRALIYQQRLEKSTAAERQRALAKESRARHKIEELGGIIDFINSEMALDSPPKLSTSALASKAGPKVSPVDASADAKAKAKAKDQAAAPFRKVEVLSHRRKQSVSKAECKKLLAASPTNKLANPAASFTANLPSCIRDPSQLSKAQSYLLQPVRSSRRAGTPAAGKRS